MPKFRTFLIANIGVIYTLLVLPFCLVYAALTRRPHCLYSYARGGFWIGLKLGGVRLSVTGQEYLDQHPTYLYIANHQSLSDPAALFLSSPHDLRFMVKKELWKLPLVNFGMYLAGFVFVDRGSGFKARPSMDVAVNRLRQGNSFLVFAEGTRTRDGRLGAFKRGPFLMAIEAGIPILPVSISGSYQVLSPSSITVRSGTIHLTFHPSIEMKGKKPKDAVSLMRQVRALIATRLPGESAVDLAGREVGGDPE